MAAEIMIPRSMGNLLNRRFNEAAANGRGNPGNGRCHRRRIPASMRPRRMAAEIPLPRERHVAGQGGFNEAAANGRGNPLAALGTYSSGTPESLQ